jgi:tetratricopeptide (TPR) repeat protein
MWVEDLLVERGKSAGLEEELVARLETRIQSLPLELSRKHGQHSATAGGHEQGYRGPERRRHRPAGQQSLHESTDELLSLSASAEDAPDPRTRSEAYGAFLRGHHEWQTFERHRMQDGLQHLTHAIELDPSLVAAKVDLAHLVVTQSMLGFMVPSVAAEIVHRTAASVSDTARNAPKMLPCLAWINFHFDRNIPAALWALKHSAHLPHDPWITRLRAMIDMSRHRFAEAIALMRSAIELDPFSPWLNSRLAWALHLDGQSAESLNQMEQCIRHFPSDEGTAFYGSQLLACHGETARAVGLAEHLTHRLSSFDPGTSVLANALACAGRRDEALSMLERLHWLGRERFVLGSFNAAAYVALGAPDAALAELQASDSTRCPWFFQILADPRMKPLHDLPGFQELQAILPRMEAAVPAESGDPDGFAANI